MQTDEPLHDADVHTYLPAPHLGCKDSASADHFLAGFIQNFDGWCTLSCLHR